MIVLCSSTLQYVDFFPSNDIRVNIIFTCQTFEASLIMIYEIRSPQMFIYLWRKFYDPFSIASEITRSVSFVLSLHPPENLF